MFIDIHGTAHDNETVVILCIGQGIPLEKPRFGQVVTMGLDPLADMTQSFKRDMIKSMYLHRFTPPSSTGVRI